MLAVYARGPSELEVVRDSLSPVERHVVLADWSTFERSLAAARCAVVFLEWLSEGDGLHRLTDTRRCMPDLPIVLVTRKDADNARLLKGLILEEVVWLHEARAALAVAVARAETRGALQLVRAAIRADRQLPPRLREALLYTCERGRLVRSVAALARALHCDRRTLWYAWHRVMPDGPRLEDLLHWLMILQAAALRSSLCSWTDVAAELQLDKRTLERYAMRLLGIRLSELARRDRRELISTFFATVVQPLIPATRLDNPP